MNTVGIPQKDLIGLNGKEVARSNFPAHWSNEFIKDLARSPGWIRYYPWDESYETEISQTLSNWSMWHETVVDALEIINTMGARDMCRESAENGIRFTMRNMLDDLQDIIELIRKTEGKWEEPEPSENLGPVDEVAS